MKKKFLYTILTVILFSIIGISSNYLYSLQANNNQLTVAFQPQIQKSPKYIQINIPSRKLFLMQDNFIIKEYSIAVGKSKEFMTPIGDFKVKIKDSAPGWSNPFNGAKIPPGASNPLGTRWIGFYTNEKGFEYGIHGTNKPDSLNKFISHGCIRMKIADSEELFNQIEINTPIKIIYNRFILEQNNNTNTLSLSILPDPYNLQPLKKDSLRGHLKSFRVEKVCAN